MNPENHIWTEKYRPKKVSEIVGDFKEKITQYLQDPKAIPNFLFYSKSPGTGKTTLAKCVINELGCDSLIINSSDDRKIETIREKVKEFAMAQTSKQGLKRCVFLDEFDGMTGIAQNALRNIMENIDYRNELMAGGGKTQVPCLRISDGASEQWMYESRDIVEYLKNT